VDSFRMYATADGESHFAELELDYQATSATVARTSPIGASNVSFNRVRPGMVLDWHHAPRRQYVFVLAGEYELEVSDGAVRRVVPGTVFLAEDLSGKGHIMRVPENEEVYIAFVPLEDQRPTS